jgi:hypothetical protein
MKKQETEWTGCPGRRHHGKKTYQNLLQATVFAWAAVAAGMAVEAAGAAASRLDGGQRSASSSASAAPGLAATAARIKQSHY